jgi:hypothetical protein
MSAISRRRLLHRLAVVSATAPAAVAAFAASAAARAGSTADEVIAQLETEEGVLRFDVAENAANFAWAGDPELVDGLPAGRTAFLSQGYIYPADTLTDSNGVLADGSPEFPDMVLGQWSCWGWYMGTGRPAGNASWLTTHLVNFGEPWGAASLVSEGYSIDDLELALERAIVGGTGPYAGARGVQLETNLGFNASNGINVRYEYRLA